MSVKQANGSKYGTTAYIVYFKLPGERQEKVQTIYASSASGARQQMKNAAPVGTKIRVVKHKANPETVTAKNPKPKKYRVVIRAGSRVVVDTVITATTAARAIAEVKARHNIPASASANARLVENPEPRLYQGRFQIKRVDGEDWGLWDITLNKWITRDGKPITYESKMDAIRKAKNMVTSGMPKRNGPVQEFKEFQKQRVNDLSAMFQGEATGKRQRVVESDLAPKGTKSRLGELVLMKVRLNGSKQIIDITFDKDAFLCMDIRKNLYAVGKGAIIENPKGLGVRVQKNGIAVVGDLIQIDYVTAKKHIENGERVRFWHPLGEIDKDYPKFGIDADNFPVIIGGGYDVWDVGIVN